MGIFSEPDGVDFVVEGGDTDPESIRQTIEYIAEYKRRPKYAEEVRKAHAILDSLRLHSENFRMTDPEALLEHWKQVAQELANDKEQRNEEPS